jgi:hypothetical protein
VATGFVVGSTVGTSIPAPVLGTLVGDLVVAIGDFAVKKAVEIPYNKAPSEQENHRGRGHHDP